MGIEAIQSTDTQYACAVNLVIEGVETALESVTYDDALTPYLSAITPRFGSVLGGESVTFTGVGFSATATTTVTIDHVPCDVTAQTTTSVTCTLRNRFDIDEDPSLEINIDGKGLVANKGHVFRYVKRWSDVETWGNDLVPTEGEAVNIPKGMHLLFDLDSSPKLSFVYVEGSLIFAPDADPNHQRTFDAHYVMVRNGYLEIGTEDFPYTSKLTITMHSHVESPYLPIYGNKVIGVRFGQLEMHGQPRPITWTDLKSTADVGAT